MIFINFKWFKNSPHFQKIIIHSITIVQSHWAIPRYEWHHKAFSYLHNPKDPDVHLKFKILSFSNLANGDKLIRYWIMRNHLFPLYDLQQILSHQSVPTRPSRQTYNQILCQYPGYFQLWLFYRSNYLEFTHAFLERK